MSGRSLFVDRVKYPHRKRQPSLDSKPESPITAQFALFQDDTLTVLRDSVAAVRNFGRSVLKPEPIPDKLYVSDGLVFGLFNGGQPPYFHHIQWERVKPVCRIEQEET